MTPTFYKNLLVKLAYGILLTIGAISIQAQTSTFSYQGRLTDGSMAANGSYDMQFKIYTAATGGTQQGITVTKTAVAVANGVFTVQIDPTISPFVSGDNRFLEIAVRLNNSGTGYTTLAPRQQITGVPYSSVGAFAFNAQNAQNADALGNVPANQYVQTGDTRLTNDRNPLAGSPNYIQNNPATAQTGGFNVSGNGSVGGNFSANNATVNALTVNGAATVTGGITGNGANISGLNATNITLGGLSDTRLSSNIPRLNAANLFTNNVSVQGDFTVGGTVTGNGSGLTSLNASSVTTGTFSDARLSANIPRKSSVNTFSANQIIDGGLFANTVDGSTINAATQFNLGGNRYIYAPGVSNTLVGRNAGGNATVGAGNSFFGTNSGFTNQNGSRNSFFGAGAGSNNTTGDDNTLIGLSAGSQNTTGSNNTFIGNGAGNSSFTNNQNAAGSNNTAIGAGANIDGNNLTYATAIGAGASANQSNLIKIGRDSQDDEVRVMGFLQALGGLRVFGDVRLGLQTGGQTSICNNPNGYISVCSSSIRYKKDVENFTSGLDLIKRLRPVTFTWKLNNQRDLGFVAEEVNAVEPLMTTYNDKGEVEGVKYDRISAALVNSVNQQQDEIKQQKEIIKRQQKQIDALTKLFCAANSNAAICKLEENK